MARKLVVDDIVEDTESHRRGRVVYVYSEPKTVVAVLFDDANEALAVHKDDVRRVRT